MGINAVVYHVSYEFVHILEVNFAPIFLGLFYYFREFTDFSAKPMMISSLSVVAFHIGKNLKSKIQRQFYSDLFNNVLPWLTSNNFTSRFYANYLVYHSWHYCSNDEYKKKF